MTHNKRLPAPKHYPIQRKQGGKYVSGIKGSRSEDTAIPAVLFLREVTEYAETAKEARRIVEENKILRNGEPLRDAKQGIGVLDVVELPDAEETFRAVKQGDHIGFIPVADGEKTAAKVVEKSAEGDEYVYRLHSGENYRSSDEYETGQTLVFNGGVKDLDLEEGERVLVIDGRHAGETGELSDISERGMKDDEVTVEAEEEFTTRKDNVVAVGDLEVTHE